MRHASDMGFSERALMTHASRFSEVMPWCMLSEGCSERLGAASTWRTTQRQLLSCLTAPAAWPPPRVQQEEGGPLELYSVYVPTNHIYVGDIFLLGKEDVIHTNLSVREGLGARRASLLGLACWSGLHAAPA